VICSPLRCLGLVLPALCLTVAGCAQAKHEARRESLERWNRVRAQVKAKLAADQLDAGHVDEAAFELAEALRLDPTNPRVVTLQARVCLTRGHLAGAERVLKTALAGSASTPEVQYLLGVIAQQRLRWDEALGHYSRAVEAAPQEVTYAVAVVQTMLQLGRAEQARDFLRCREDEYGWTGAYHAAMAECCEQTNQWQAATAAWEKVIDGSNDPAVQERLALALCRCGRWADAIPHLRQLIEQAKDDCSLTSLRTVLARCLLENGEALAAQQQLGHVLREDPQNAPALQLLARAFAQEGHIVRARRCAERALRLTPENQDAMELVAALAYRLGDQESATALAKQILHDPAQASAVASEILTQVAAAAPTQE
jgi:tetratricopeptide (TPR) repeat protein